MSVRISVIVLTYNQEKTINVTLDNILGQEGAPDYEIIIGEDCSEDGTRSVCEDYARRYPDKVRLMPKEGNKGLVRNYRDCFLAAKGDYIADCSGDDCWIDRKFLSKSFKLLDEQGDVSLVYGGLAGGRQSGEGRKAGGAMLESLLQARGIQEIVLSASVYRKSGVVDLIEGGEMDSYTAEDYPILARLLSRGDAYCLGREVLRYDSVSPSLSRPEGEIAKALAALEGMAMRLELAEKYGVAPIKLKGYFSEAIDFVSAMLLRHPGAELLGRLDEMVERWELSMPKKARLYRAIMRSGASWRLAAAIRNYFLR